MAAGLLLALFAAFLFAFEIRKQGFHWTVFAESLRTLDWRWLVGAVLFAYLTYVGRALRWEVLLRPLRPHPRFGPLLSATIIGFTATTILGRAGELVRPYLIATREDVPFPSQIAAWVVERIYDILVALAVFGFALSRVRSEGLELGAALSWVLEVGGAAIALVSALCLLLLLGMAYFGERMQSGVLRAMSFLSAHHLGRVEKMLEAFLDGVRATKSQSATAKMILYTLLEWLLIAMCYGCLVRCFGPALKLNAIDILIFMGFVSFGSLVQLPGVGGGVQVTALLVLTEIFGVPVEIATSVAILTWAITFVAIVPFGLGLALHEGLSWAGLRGAGLPEDAPYGHLTEAMEPPSKNSGTKR